MKNKMKSLVALAIVCVVFTTTAQTEKKLNVETSTITWEGKKITGAHQGTLNFKEGVLVYNEDLIQSGSLTVDMTSIVVTDLEAGKGKEKLEGHLKADDFFGTEVNPTASLTFVKATKSETGYAIEGELTIKGKTAPLNFDLVKNEDGYSTKVIVNRTVYGIKYGSGSFFTDLGDKAIADEFSLEVNLKF